MLISFEFDGYWITFSYYPPLSFLSVFQLPPAQLENALNRIAALKAPLISHANQPHVRSLLPRSVHHPVE